MSGSPALRFMIGLPQVGQKPLVTALPLSARSSKVANSPLSDTAAPGMPNIDA